MRKFNVSFWYSTDRRFDIDVEATDYTNALVLAMMRWEAHDWPVVPPFHIKIEPVGA